MKRSARQWEQLRLSLLSAYDSSVPSAGNQKSITSPDYTVWLIREGGVAMESETSSLQIHAGNWIVIPPGYKRKQFFSSGSRILSIHFLASWPGERPVLRLNVPLVMAYDSWQELEPLSRTVAAYSRAGLSEIGLSGFASLKAQFLEWLSIWYTLMVAEGIEENVAGELDPRILAALKEMNAQTYAGTVPYEALRAASNLSRVHLDRLFVEQLGKTPKRYMEERCLRRICELLLTTAMPIKEICYATGFASPAHFSNWFRRQTACTPAQYRKDFGRK